MSRNRKTVFIDRDGVINKDPGGWTEHNYVTKWKYFRFVPGSKKAIRNLSYRGYDVVIISNQAGISKGHYSSEKLDRINARMLKEIAKNGGTIKRTYYCVHQDNDNCDCRKPKIGLFRQAEKELGIKAQGTYFIGDGRADIEAGKKARLKAILVLSGKTRLEDVGNWEVKPDLIFKDLSEAVDFILKGEDR